MLSGVAFGADGGVALGVGGSGNGMRITLKCRPRHSHRPNVFREIQRLSQSASRPMNVATPLPTSEMTENTRRSIAA